MTVFFLYFLFTPLSPKSVNRLYGNIFIWGVFGLSSKPVMSIFTARLYASAVYVVVLFECVYPLLRITQTKSHDSHSTQRFWYQRSPQNSNGITPYGATKTCRWGRL